MAALLAGEALRGGLAGGALVRALGALFLGIDKKIGLALGAAVRFSAGEAVLGAGFADLGRTLFLDLEGLSAA